MPNDPLLTRETLLIRLRDPDNRDSWAEFAEIYTPLLYGYCQRRELRHADTADITQDVMRSISLALAKGQYDPNKGKFRSWLFTCLRNAMCSHFKKQSRHPLSVAETAVLDAISAEPAEAEELAWERDYQSQLINWAIEKIRPEFSPRIWRAFEATALEELDTNEVVKELGISKNALGVAKHRVMKRLKEKVESIDADRWEQEMIQRQAAG